MKFKRRKKRYNRKTDFLFLFLIIIIGSMSLGYALLTQDVSILGSAKLKNATWDVHFANVQPVSGSVAADSGPTISNNDTKVTFSATLNEPSEFYSFNVDVVNAGSIDAMIDDIKIKPELTADQKKYLTYDVTYKNDTPIQVEDVLTGGTTKTLKVYFEYVDGLDSDEYPDEDQSFDFTFELNFSQADSSESGKTFAEYLISKANKKTITSYSDGKKAQMYTFDHGATDQTGPLTDYRYIGNEPNNYIYFNCQDDSKVETCEVWRIIGVFEVEDENGNKANRVKIIKGNSIDIYKFSVELYLEWGLSNNWRSSNLRSYLNDDYFDYFFVPGYIKSFSDTARKMIGTTKYYLGGLAIEDELDNLNASHIYARERNNNVLFDYGDWVGNIGLMYPSDYVYTYALGVNEKCFNDAVWCEEGEPSTGWIYNSNINEGSTNISGQWTMTHNYNGTYSVCKVDFSGYLFYSPAYSSGIFDEEDFGFRPVLYLTSDTYLFDGDGSKNNPYQIKLSSN